jgi:nicotinamidase-related amidase
MLRASLEEDWMRRVLSKLVIVAATGLVGTLGSTAAGAGTIIDDWASVKAEPAPELKPVTIDTKTTALLVMDLVKGSCNNERRPRCVASIPAVAKFINDARAKGLTVIHTTAGPATAADILPEVAPKDGEQLITGTNPDKFLKTDLEKILKDKGFSNVITVGTAAHGAILYTASEAALRGIKVIVPVDGSSSENMFAEQAVTWILARAPTVSTQVTLTKFDMMKF